jgi:hypothetical protein
MNDRTKQLSRTFRRNAAPLLILAALLGPGSAAAQTAGPTPDELHNAAQLLFTTPTRHAEAARLLCREADLRSSDDPDAVQAALLCGRLYYYGGELTRSRNALEDAARRALAIGDVIRAAHAFVDASLVAERQGKSRAVSALAGKARMLARSPLLTSSQRHAIEERVGGAIPVGTS